MAETALYKQLETYNKTIANKYRANWGSMLTYVDNTDTKVLNEVAENGSPKKQQALTQESRDHKSAVTNRSRVSSLAHSKIESMHQSRFMSPEASNRDIQKSTRGYLTNQSEWTRQMTNTK